MNTKVYHFITSLFPRRRFSVQLSDDWRVMNAIRLNSDVL